MSKSFSDLEEVAENGLEGCNLLLVDGLNLAFRYKHKNQRNFAADYLRTVNSLAKSYSAGKVVICSDFGSSSYRKNIYPEYKGNRAALREKQTEEEAQNFINFLEDFEDSLTLCANKYPVLKYKNVEADDIIAYIAQRAKNTEHTWIISSDKDLDQLIDTKTSRFSYYTRKEVTLNNFYEVYGCTPEEYISVKVLQGDAGDNIPGVPGVGPKRAVAFIKKYGSALELWEALPIQGSQVVTRKINEFGDGILLNYELMDLRLCETALGENSLTIDNFLKEQNIV